MGTRFGIARLIGLFLADAEPHGYAREAADETRGCEVLCVSQPRRCLVAQDVQKVDRRE